MMEQLVSSTNSMCTCVYCPCESVLPSTLGTLASWMGYTWLVSFRVLQRHGIERPVCSFLLGRELELQQSHQSVWASGLGCFPSLQGAGCRWVLFSVQTPAAPPLPSWLPRQPGDRPCSYRPNLPGCCQDPRPSTHQHISWTLVVKVPQQM